MVAAQRLLARLVARAAAVQRLSDAVGAGSLEQLESAIEHAEGAALGQQSADDGGAAAAAEATFERVALQEARQRAAELRRGAAEAAAAAAEAAEAEARRRREVALLAEVQQAQQAQLDRLEPPAITATAAGAAPPPQIASLISMASTRGPAAVAPVDAEADTEAALVAAEAAAGRVLQRLRLAIGRISKLREAEGAMSQAVAAARAALRAQQSARGPAAASGGAAYERAYERLRQRLAFLRRFRVSVLGGAHWLGLGLGLG